MTALHKNKFLLSIFNSFFPHLSKGKFKVYLSLRYKTIFKQPKIWGQNELHGVSLKMAHRNFRKGQGTFKDLYTLKLCNALLITY